MSANCNDASNGGGEGVQNPACNKATVQGDANKNGAAPDTSGQR